MSTQVLVNTGSILIQAANDEEGGGGLVGQRQYCYGSTVRSTKRRHLSNSEANFEVFCPAGATCCTDGGETEKNCNRKWKFATGNRN